MPIYAYRCSTCGFAQDVLQKMSDAPLAVCPQCHATSFTKQVTAAGFQLKGSGWYVTDFRNTRTAGLAGAADQSATGDAGASVAAEPPASAAAPAKAEAAAAVPAASPAGTAASSTPAP
jgi:putative FmdB family regulatory protein